MNNKQIAHLWANQSREGAMGSHFFFDHDIIYSYGLHFPIARLLRNGNVLFTTQDYSVTTAKHKGYVRNACTNRVLFYVDDVTKNPGAHDLKSYRERIAKLVNAAARGRPGSRTNAFTMQAVESLVKEARLFCEQFGFKTKFEMPDNWEALREQAKAGIAKAKKAEAKRQAAYEQQQAENLAKWLAGQDVPFPSKLTKVYLRKIHPNGDEGGELMQTSLGALVPLEDARKTYLFVSRKRASGWHHNGEQFKVGEFHLDAVTPEGVVAGCHRITWEEIDRFATLMGWQSHGLAGHLNAPTT